MPSQRLSTEAHWLVFEVGSELCGLPVPSVQEILALPWLSRPPGLPPLMEGFVNLGGMAVPVLRASRLFGLADVLCNPYTPLVILRGGKGLLGLLVERIRDVRPIAEATPAPIEERHSLNGCTAAQVCLVDDIVHLLSPERLLLEEEARRVASLREMEAQRLGLLERGTE